MTNVWRMMTNYNCEHCRDTGRALDPDNRPYKIVCPRCKGNCWKVTISQDVMTGQTLIGHKKEPHRPPITILDDFEEDKE